MSILEWVVVPLLCLCALQAVRAPRLLNSALWLAGASACLAMLLYRLGARQVAVIELSVGAGLVTVLFVFALAVAGEDGMGAPAVVPKPLAWMLAGLVGALLALLLLGGQPVPPASTAAVAESVTWGARALDLALLVLLIFAGALGVAGLLADEDVGYTMPDLRTLLLRAPEKEEVKR